MNVIFIGYWGANEGLSQSTINPHLLILKNLGVKAIYYISVERGTERSYNVPTDDEIHHVPVQASQFPVHFVGKFLDFKKVSLVAAELVKTHTIDMVICRTAIAGVFGYWLKKRFRIPYIVESYEPHADYMLDAGVWSRYGLSYQLQNRWEIQIKKTANYLLPVANNYKSKLIEEGVEEQRIYVAPCAVDPEKFKFNKVDRKSIRDRLGIADDVTVGIYVGKFGGIYYDKEAFNLFAETFRNFPSFYLILLTPTAVEVIDRRLDAVGIDKRQVFAGLVDHTEIPAFLSASDFAYSLHLPTPANRFVSPIKNGEYWANGLPVIISEGVGDDWEIIRDNKKGVLLSFPLQRRVFRKIAKDILSPRDNGLALTYRSFEDIRRHYELILDRVTESLTI